MLGILGNTSKSFIYLNDMRYTALNKKDYKMAAYCKSVKAFVELYTKSLKEQKRL